MKCLQFHVAETITADGYVRHYQNMLITLFVPSRLEEEQWLQLTVIVHICLFEYVTQTFKLLASLLRGRIGKFFKLLTGLFRERWRISTPIPEDVEMQANTLI